MDLTPGLRNTGSCGQAVAWLRMVWNAIIDPPVPWGSAQAVHRHCARPFPGESGLATRDYAFTSDDVTGSWQINCGTKFCIMKSTQSILCNEINLWIHCICVYICAMTHVRV